MTAQEARAYLHHLMTLCLHKEEAFAPLALKFVKEHDLARLDLQPEEQVNLLLAMAEAYGDEPKRYPQKLECLQKAVALMSSGRWSEQQRNRRSVIRINRYGEIPLAPHLSKAGCHRPCRSHSPVLSARKIRKN